MENTYALTSQAIRENVLDITGVYVLGHISSETGDLKPEYVGRSDGELQTRLLKWVDQYEYFKFSYSPDPVGAFYDECKLYHLLGGSDHLDNENHPDVPDGYSSETLSCPVQGCNE